MQNLTLNITWSKLWDSENNEQQHSGSSNETQDIEMFGFSELFHHSRFQTVMDSTLCFVAYGLFLCFSSFHCCHTNQHSIVAWNQDKWLLAMNELLIMQRVCVCVWLIRQKIMKDSLWHKTVFANTLCYVKDVSKMCLGLTDTNNRFILTFSLAWGSLPFDTLSFFTSCRRATFHRSLCRCCGIRASVSLYITTTKKNKTQ